MAHLCSRHCAFGIVSAQAGIRTAVGATFTFAGPAPGIGSFPGFPSILDRWIRYEEEKFRDR